MDNETESSRISIAFICASGRLRSRYFRLSGQGDILVVGLAEEDFSVIPGGSSGNRVRMVTKIEFVPLESGQ